MKAFFDWYLGDKINLRLTKGFTNVRNCMFHLQKFGVLNFVGYGLSSGPEKPGTKRKLKGVKKEKMERLERAYKKIISKLDKSYEKRDKKDLTIFITHNIPYNTKLDVVKDKKSYAYGKHLGSTVARQFCTRKKPLLCVGGHVHEGRGRDKIGKTVVVNPGMGNVLVEIDENRGKIKSIKFLK